MFAYFDFSLSKSIAASSQSEARAKTSVLGGSVSIRKIWHELLEVHGEESGMAGPGNSDNEALCAFQSSA